MFQTFIDLFFGISVVGIVIVGLPVLFALMNRGLKELHDLPKRMFEEQKKRK